MAYPVVSGPYGLKPVNLIGGQNFAGSTRQYVIPYGYNTDIGSGDFVGLSRGLLKRIAVTSAGGSSDIVGVFAGCAFTNPITLQKTFSQKWPAGTLAGDAVAYVVDDYDAVFTAVVCSSGVVVGSAAQCLVGQNLQMLDNGISAATGVSLNAVASVAATPATTSTFPVRVLGLVPDTAVAVTAIGSSATTSITLTGSGLPSAIVAGCDVGYYAAGSSQFVQTGSFVTTAAIAGATTVTLNQRPIVQGSAADIPSGALVVFTQYPEVLIKLNFGIHGYQVATAVA